MKIGFYSGGRGGVGKTTLSVLYSIAVAKAGYRVLLIDLGEYGNSATYTLLASPQGPFIKDYLAGGVPWQEVIQEVEVSWREGGRRCTATMLLAPSNGYLENLSLERLEELIANIAPYTDQIVVDFPSDPLRAFHPLVNTLDTVVLLGTPDYRSVKAISSLQFSRPYTIPVLNKYMGQVYHLEKLRDTYGVAYTLPFDPVLADLNPNTLVSALGSISKRFQEKFAALIKKILVPRVKAV